MLAGYSIAVTSVVSGATRKNDSVIVIATAVSPSAPTLWVYLTLKKDRKKGPIFLLRFMPANSLVVPEKV
jgi:hypothetical protein